MAVAAEVGPGVEEVPEGGAVSDGMVEGATDEDAAIGQFGDLNSEERHGVAVAAEHAVEGEEGLDDGRDVERGEDVGHCHVVRGRMDELGSLIVAIEEDGEGVGLLMFRRDEAASQREEVVEGMGEGGQQAGDDDGGGGVLPAVFFSLLI